MPYSHHPLTISIGFWALEIIPTTLLGPQGAYMKILESSQTLLHVLKRETVNLTKCAQLGRGLAEFLFVVPVVPCRIGDRCLVFLSGWRNTV